MALIDLKKTPLKWKRAVPLAFGHLGSLYAFYLTLTSQSQLITFIYVYIIGYLGVVLMIIGNHRLFTHKSFKATLPLRLLLLYGITFIGHYSAYSWVKIHKLHHEFCETDADPHNAKRGFLFSHMGWMVIKKHPECRAKGKLVNMKDLENDGLIMFQKKYFLPLHFIFGILIPISIPWYFWGESLWNSLFVVYIFRYVMSLHHVSVANSFSHLSGTKAYNKNKPGCFNKISHIITFGVDSQHNYHHTFPWDYRSSEGKHSKNLENSLIELFAKLGMAYDLKTVSPELVFKTVKKYGDGSYDN